MLDLCASPASAHTALKASGATLSWDRLHHRRPRRLNVPLDQLIAYHLNYPVSPLLASASVCRRRDHGRVDVTIDRGNHPCAPAFSAEAPAAPTPRRVGEPTGAAGAGAAPGLDELQGPSAIEHWFDDSDESCRGPQPGPHAFI